MIMLCGMKLILGTSTAHSLIFVISVLKPAIITIFNLVTFFNTKNLGNLLVIILKEHFTRMFIPLLEKCLMDSLGSWEDLMENLNLNLELSILLK